MQRVYFASRCILPNHFNNYAIYSLHLKFWRGYPVIVALHKSGRPFKTIWIHKSTHLLHYNSIKPAKILPIFSLSTQYTILYIDKEGSHLYWGALLVYAKSLTHHSPHARLGALIIFLVITSVSRCLIDNRCLISKTPSRRCLHQVRDLHTSKETLHTIF